MAAGSELKTIVKGGGTLLLGRLAKQLLQLITGIIVIRVISKPEYGLISLSYTIVNIFVFVTLLGVQSGAARLIAKYRAQANKSMIGYLAGSALFITLLTSISIFFMIFSYSAEIAFWYSKPELAPVLRIIVLILIPLVLIRAYNAIFRGLRQVWQKVIFQDVGLMGARFALLMLGLLAGYKFGAVLMAYVVSAWFSFVIYSLYTKKELSGRFQIQISLSTIRELLVFSLPLLSLGVLPRLMNWFAILLVGYMGTASDVASYNAPMHLVQILLIGISTMTYLYLPVATKLFIKDAKEELKSLYISVAKISFLISLPLVIFILFDAELIVVHLFGEQYKDAAGILVVLALGYSIRIMIGPGPTTLVSSGAPGVVLIFTIVALVLMLSLCTMLIPEYGGLGAAIGTGSGVAVLYILSSLYLYIKERIHVISINYIKPVAFTIAVSVFIYYISNGLELDAPIIHVFILSILILTSIASPVITRAMSSEDLELLRALEMRIHNNSRISDKVTLWVRMDAMKQ